MTALLELDGVSREFTSHRGVVHAVSDMSFSLCLGESVGLVGESGCGKSTVGRLAVGLLPPSAGEIRFNGKPLLLARGRRDVRGQLQMIFQDPVSSFNPRWPVGDSIAEPLLSFGLNSSERQKKVFEMLDLVGLTADQAKRYPHEFSGGQRQRMAIARALITQPRLVVCDEPVSALDVSVQAQVLNVLRHMQERFQPAYIFISHDLAVVNFLCTRVLVMYLGQLVEELPQQALNSGCCHPYTRALLSAASMLSYASYEDDTTVHNTSKSGIFSPSLEGELPSPLALPAGCPFHPRCPYAQAICQQQMPAWHATKVGRVRCHFPVE